jgi:MICOS complex subunit MIC12
MKEVQAGAIEMAKDRWNREIEGLLRRTYETDWNAVRGEWENRIVGVVGRVREKAADAGKNASS